MNIKPVTLFLTTITSFASPCLLAAPSTADIGIEEVVVTAQSRDQKIIDIPFSLTSVSGRQLEDNNIDRFDELAKFIPGLSIYDQGPSNNSYVIRGIGSSNGQASASARVSVYLNGIDISRSRSAYFELYDMDRIEVLKGPQATLFGNAAAIGAIASYTRLPEQPLSGQLDISAGNYDEQSASGAITGGNELIQVRLAGYYKSRDGFVDNIAGNKESLGSIERNAIRPTIQFTPNDDLRFTFIYNHEEADDGANSFKSAVFAPANGDTRPHSYAALGGSPYSQEHLGGELGVERETEDFNLRMLWQISSQLTLNYIGGYRDYDSLEVFDADGTAAPFAEFSEQADGDQHSQELRINFSNDSIQAFAGIHYQEEDARRFIRFSTEESVFLNCIGRLSVDIAPCLNNDGSYNVLTPILTRGLLDELPYTASYINQADNSLSSVFADINFTLTPALEMSAGLRYIQEKKETRYSAYQPNSVLSRDGFFGIVDTQGQDLVADKNFDAWLPRANILYHYSDNTNLFASISKGRRSPVVDVLSAADDNNQPVADTTIIPEEKIWNYELGIRGEVGRLSSYSASIFYQDYENFQVNRISETTEIITENAGTATNIGIEAEATFSVNEHWTLLANAAYIDAEIDDDQQNGLYAGKRFRQQPRWTSTLGFSFQQAISSDLNLFSYGSWSYRSDIFFTEDNLPVQGKSLAQSDINIVDFKIGLTANDQKWSVAAYGKNIFNKKYITDAGNIGTAFSSPTYIAAAPATYGVEANLKF
jgi:outer membrane receptor protein involved in Fe transport